jgi:protoporphyrinogen IX oxidase
MLYQWIVAFHIIAVIAWMAGMLYLPRLFVYHCVSEKGSAQAKTFALMERRLLRAIMNPAMIATWLLGLWLAWHGPDSHYGWFGSGWLHAKLLLVVALSALHGMYFRWAKDFAADNNRYSQRFYRIINEIPTVLMIGIVILAVVKPF